MLVVDDAEDDSSDENDSTAAAHAAAIGHTPVPVAAEEGATEEKDEALESTSPPPAAETAAEPMETDNGDDEPPKNHQEASDNHEKEATENPTEEAPVEASEKPEETSAMPVDSEPPGQEVTYRLADGVNLNERDDDENTPLHIAIHNRKLDHVKLLLQYGASQRMRCDGSWPIHTAISIGALHPDFAYDCVMLLHENGADLTAKDDSNHTPLFLACVFGLPQIATYLLANEVSTLNTRADRLGNRPLHAVAKFEAARRDAVAQQPIPGFPGKLEATALKANEGSVACPLTKLLLGATGIEVDGQNALGQTALHMACLRGNWPVARLLLEAGASPTHADRRGFTPGQTAHKRGMPIPVDLRPVLGEPPVAGLLPPPRDLIVDPDGSTLLLSHELCTLHRTCPPIRRDAEEPPPENVRRLTVLIDEATGILRCGEFGQCVWKGEARRAAMGDVLKVHEYTYVESISRASNSIPDIPNAVANLDPDTAISRWSFEAAMRAAGSVCEAVDSVLAGDHRNAFCAVRPPGHHAGPRGIVRCANDPEGGSHGFYLLNNVAIGAAYARSMYRNEGIKKVAIIDFDVHHGNGTEEIIRRLIPTAEKSLVRTPFAFGELQTSSYSPWLDETDIENVFFASTHGYGQRGHEQMGWFYPASGKTHISEALKNPSMVEQPNTADFLFSQTWARMGEENKLNCCKIIDMGLELPEQDPDPQGRAMKQRLDLRDTYRHKIFPYLREFDPDLIFISAGFDAHRRDSMNFGYVGMVEEDYEWVTEQLVKIANTCCNGRVISVLEGGYKIHGGIVSPFARSVASHVRALVDGGRSRELYDPKDVEWESQFERHIYERRERKKEEERDRLRLMQQQATQALLDSAAGDDPDAPSRKRRRNQVDYKELFKQMQQEGFGS